MTPLVRPLFRFLRLPLTPPAPIAGAELRQVLQPARRTHHLRLLKWTAAQVSALMGVLLLITAIDFTQWLPAWLRFVEVFNRWDDFTDYLPAEWRWVGLLLVVGGFLTQAAFSFLALWAERHTTWYVISDQGVQLQHGVWTTHETSLRFANIQQVSLRQGVLQRLIGLADVVVSTAGGRRSADDDEDAKRKNQGQLRDLDYTQAQRLLETLRGQLEAPYALAAPAPAPDVAALEAAQLLLAEAQALRRSVATRPSSPPAQPDESPVPIPADPVSDP